jgi:hypothetical protein
MEVRSHVEDARAEAVSTSRPRSEKARPTTAPTAPVTERRDAHKLPQEAHRVLAPGMYGAAYGLCESVIELYHASRPPFLFPVTRHRSMRLFSRQRPACLTRWRCVISIVILERGFEREDPVQRDVVPS